MSKFVPMNGRDVAWARRRLPAAIRSAIEKCAFPIYVAGGYVRSVIADEKVNDIDLFCGAGGIEAAKLAISVATGRLPAATTKNAITWKARPWDVQLIIRWLYESPEACAASFDFTMAQAVLYCDGSGGANPHWKGIVSETFYADGMAKRLMYTCPDRDEDSAGSLLRVLKFYQRGYRIPVDSLADVVARAVKGLPMTTGGDERIMAREIQRRLRLVDPNADPAHDAHLPAARATAEGVDTVAEDEVDG